MTRIKWSQEESDLLEKVYKYKTANELREIFPQYTNTQILRRAKKLGLKKDKLVAKKSRLENSIIQRQDLWTEEELKILVEHYPSKGSLGVQERLPKHRELENIKKKANSLGVLRKQKDLLWKVNDYQINESEQFAITIKYKGY